MDLTFFDPPSNDTFIDLSNVPVPIQTNISGVSVTGIAPTNLGTIRLPSDDDDQAVLNAKFPLQVPILPNAVISVKHNISTINEDKSAQILSEIPQLLGLTSPITGEPIKIATKVEKSQQSEEVKGDQDKLLVRNPEKGDDVVEDLKAVAK